MSDKLGDRMKNYYENTYRRYLTRRTPVIIRVDGKAFHTYTRGFKRPFDETLCRCMLNAAEDVQNLMQGCIAWYAQSDEVSFLLKDYESLETEAWFGYNQSKIETVTASMMTAFFNRHINIETLAVFDARSFSIPKEEVVNYFLWRAHDWKRNSLSMYSRTFFSQKQLHGKNSEQMRHMLAEIGKDWEADVPLKFKYGVFWVNGETVSIPPTYENIAKILEKEICRETKGV